MPDEVEFDFMTSKIEVRAKAVTKFHLPQNTQDTHRSGLVSDPLEPLSRPHRAGDGVTRCCPFPLAGLPASSSDPLSAIAHTEVRLKIS